MPNYLYKSLQDKQRTFAKRGLKLAEQIDTKRQFDDLYLQLKANEHFIFRGVNEAKYKMFTSLQRAYHSGKISRDTSPSDFVANEIKHLKEDKPQLLHNYYQSLNIADSDYVYLSFLQHYGALTPFIDFTKALDIALYFATENISYPNINNNTDDIENYLSLYWLNIQKLNELPDIIDIHKTWFMDGFNAYLYAQELDKSLNIGTQILNVESFLAWKNSNSTGLAEIDLGYIRNNHPTSKIVLPYEADRHLEHVKQLAKNGKLTLRGKNLYINKVMRCIEHTARLTNLNIVAQNGCFILYNPLEHDKGKPMIDTPLEDFWVNNPTFKILPTINCVNIHKSLAEYIIHNLIKNGVTRNTIYPDNRVMANNAYKQTKIN